MKEEELMINDWVYGYGNQPIKIPAIPIDGHGIVKSPFYPATIEECKPIPLTDEILEKNGFKEGWTECFKGYNLMKSSRGYYSIEDHCLIELRYVHELQHALKLCGIEKEIVL